MKNAHCRVLVLLAAFTALRFGEPAALQRRDIDLEARTVFVGARGGVLRRNNFRRIWLRALDATGLGDVHFHDLRHTGNTLAATGGATTRELMHRMGHSSVRAALIYQHLVNGRDHQIADYVDGQIRKVKRPPHDPSGT
ncbi:tyrosine-type recombinase/integrase [Streptomyces sp. NBC_00035]|uniref:tyrosine-type recombinase/integrase n=1 Tax=Streptomyces sp. NBC_00035 TaxID=2903614 RepID=UPI00386ADA03